MARDLRLDTKYLEGFVTEEDLEGILPAVEKAHTLLEDRSGPGKEFLGWMDLPEAVGDDLLGDIEETASRMDRDSDAIIVIGIGGSYLGAKAAIEMLVPEFGERKVYFAGYNLSGDYLEGLLDKLKDKDISVNVISKSGTTTETAIAFRIIRSFLKKKYGPDKIKDRIVCTTDREKGALKSLADKEGYRAFAIPEDVGGRYSVLTPAGLLPIACAGVNIRKLIDGAKDQRQRSLSVDIDLNPSYRYAGIRNILYRKGKKIEILAGFDHKFHYIGEWWKQLFAESEGKGSKGIFPALCDFPTDLHSIGQLIQQGERNLFETFLVAEKEDAGCCIPPDIENIDGLNYLSGRKVGFVNRQAYHAAAEAHFEGGVPNSTIMISERSPFCLGQLFYFFEKAVALSGYLSGVNPFDQQGVEAYKRKMFKLLGKPGA